MQTIVLKTAPEIKAVIRAAFPGYRKLNAFLSVFGEHGKSVEIESLADRIGKLEGE